MFTLAFNNEAFPAPTEYGLGKEPIGKFERNANGGLVGDLTAVKLRITAAWDMLSGADYARLLGYASDCFVAVTYTDPEGAATVCDMYVRLHDGGLCLVDAEPRWQNVSVELAER